MNCNDRRHPAFETIPALRFHFLSTHRTVAPNKYVLARWSILENLVGGELKMG